MKFFITLTVLLSSVSVFGQYVDRSKTDALVKSEMQHAGKLQGKVATLSDSIDVHYHEVNWTVYPGDGMIAGDVKTNFEVSQSQISNLYFDMSDDLDVDSVVYHGVQIVAIRPNDNTVVIHLPSTLNLGESDSITIYYHGIPSGSFETDTHGAGINEVWTISEPYGASEWWPCKNSLNDKIDSMDINITTSLGNMAGSLGLLQSVDTVGTDVIYHWQHRFPVTTYLVSLAVTNYVEFTEYVHVGLDSFPVLNYVYPEDLFYAEATIPRIIPMFRVFDSLFIPYPFMTEKYGHAQTQIGGGMEHQTMSTMGFFGDDLMAHELAHQWFGDLVTCESWAELWLNEGFATYLTGLAIENLKPKSSWNAWKTGKIASVRSQPGGSVFVTDTLNLGRLFSSRLTYDKGGLLLHMLRWKLGDADFFLALRNYLNDPQLEFGYVTNADLIGHLEAVSGLDLTEFFNDWFYGEGYPTYTVLVSGTQPNYAVNIKQVTSHSSVDFFEMPLEIEINADTSYVFENTVNDQWISFTYDGPINYIKVDPNKWILMGKASFILGNEEVEMAKITPLLFPQPANENVTITNVSSGIDEGLINVFDISGSKVSLFVNRRGNDISLDVSKLSSGIYFVSHPEWKQPLRLIKH